MAVERADRHSISEEIISASERETDAAGGARQEKKEVVAAIATAVEGEIEPRASEPTNDSRKSKQLLRILPAVLVEKRPRKIERYDIIDEPGVRECVTRVRLGEEGDLRGGKQRAQPNSAGSTRAAPRYLTMFITMVSPLRLSPLRSVEL